MKIHHVLLLMASIIFSTGCDYILGNDPSDSPLATFDYTWKFMDENYAGFITKDVDWNAVRDTYRPQIAAENTAAKLNEVIRSIIDLLNDGHMRLYNEFGTYPDFPAAYSSASVVRNKYLLTSANDSTGTLVYGDISDTIGYLSLSSFSSKGSSSDNPKWEGTLSAALNTFSSKKYLIIDLRKNGGGKLQYSDTFVSYFLKKDSVVNTMYIKNGKGENDYTVKEHTISSKGRDDKFKLIVLVDTPTCSAADIATLELRNNCGAILAGRSNRAEIIAVDGFGELPNGWVLRLGWNTVFTFPGIKDGDMIYTDIESSNSKTDLANKTDPQLEAAVAWANAH
jgi:hypothetical protein